MFHFGKKDSSNDISSLNQAGKYEKVNPGYEQDLSSKRVIDFAYLPNDQVLLIGSMDGQYPYWVSVTDVNDTVTNTKIADQMLFGDFSVFTKTWPEQSIRMKDCYRRRFYINNGQIKTPFDYGFSCEPGQLKYWGMYIAKGIYSHYLQMKEICRYRELDGRYLEFLKEYLALLKKQTNTDDVKNYEEKRNLIRLIESEDYLYLSENKKIRQTYIQIREEIGHLYNLYMSIVR